VEGKKIKKTKEAIKQKISAFWETHKDFNDRNPDDIRNADNLCRELLDTVSLRGLPPTVLIEAIEELKAEIAVEKARKEFYNK